MFYIETKNLDVEVEAIIRRFFQKHENLISIRHCEDWIAL